MEKRNFFQRIFNLGKSGEINTPETPPDHRPWSKSDRFMSSPLTDIEAGKKHVRSSGRDERWRYHGYGYGQTIRISDKIEQFIDTDLGPRESLADCRAIEQAFPFVSKAIKLHADVMGSPVPVTDDERLNEEIQAFWNEFKVTGEVLTTHDDDIGMDVFARALLTQTLTDGLQPYHIELMEDGRTPMGGRVHDAEKFLFSRQNDLEVKNLIYNAINGSVVVPQDDLWRVVKLYRNSRWAWGVPMTYKAVFFANQCLWVLSARKDTHVRISNPPSITTIGYNPPDNERLSPQEYQALLNDAKEKGKDIQKEFEGALADMYRSGRPFDATMINPGTYTINSKMFGQGAKGLTEYVPEAEFYTRQMATSMDVPIVFLDFTMPAGFGSDIYRIQSGIMHKRKSWHQAEIGSHVGYITKLWAISQSKNPATIAKIENGGIGWQEINIDDLKAIAETEKVQAETLEKQFENYLRIRMELTSRVIANTYAESIGHPEWME